LKSTETAHGLVKCLACTRIPGWALEAKRLTEKAASERDRRQAKSSRRNKEPPKKKKKEKKSDIKLKKGM